MKNKNIYFTKEAIEIAEKYMQENNVTFNKAINTLIINNKNILTLEAIKTGILKLHKEFQEIKKNF